MENTKKITYKLGEFTTQYEPFGEKNTCAFSLANAGSTDNPGEPKLPRESVLVALPDGALVTDISVTEKRSERLYDRFQVLCVPEPATEGEALKFTPSSAIYGSIKDFPSMLAENAGQENIGGINCVNILVYPVVWNPQSKNITLHREIEITITYTLDETEKRKFADLQKKRQLPKYFADLIYGLEEAEKS
jgi:hypothetical protein